MKLIAGLDIGNGYVKSSVSGQKTGMTVIDIPSCVANRSPNESDVRKTNPQDVVDEVADIYNVMDVSFKSPLIDSDRRCLVGQRAIMVGRTLKQFDVHASRGKSKNPMSPMLALVCVAGKALQDYCTETGRLPDKPLDVEVIAAMALPISEFKDYRKPYANGYMEGTHVVTIHNFENDIVINVKFLKVMVNAEGAAAQYGIISKGEDMIAALLEDLRQHGYPMTGYKPVHIMNARNVMGVDIGEGTVNFPVFVDGKFNTDVSRTMEEGYASVLDRAVTKMQAENRPYKTRKALAEFLNGPNADPTHPAYALRYKPIQDIVDKEIFDFADAISSMFSTVLDSMGVEADVVYVYGGGASPVEHDLYGMLLKTMADRTGGELAIPVLYMDSRYSRNLNREGLFAMAEAVAAQSTGKK